ncbi:MAG: hypothetical protein Q8R79_07540 [Legionellaceae bacterium]|nr:hypothetical protein [Legionellaceae bacterium]
MFFSGFFSRRVWFKRWKIKKLTKKANVMRDLRMHNPVDEQAIAKEVGIYHRLSFIYSLLVQKKRYPHARVMVIESLRAAAALDDAKAQFDLAMRFLEEAKFRKVLQDEELFASTVNDRTQRQLFEEAHAYLEAAERLGHIQAKRVRGLCYINGWGVEKDKDKGFEFVVASIEQEKSWDRVPAIFAEIGLNKPEFFTALGARKRP